MHIIEGTATQLQIEVDNNLGRTAHTNIDEIITSVDTDLVLR